MGDRMIFFNRPFSEWVQESPLRLSTQQLDIKGEIVLSTKSMNVIANWQDLDLRGDQVFRHTCATGSVA
jgi:hypothetical protein